jgi:hypothetical protein
VNQASLYAMPLFAFVAALYSSVGHGGATGYLALMSFMGLSPDVMSTTALVLNLLTASISCFVYARAGFFSIKLTMPFILSSIPAALLGSMVPLDERQYSWMLACALIVTAVLLVYSKWKTSGSTPFSSPPALYQGSLVGGTLGFVSGAIGIGGGVFLSPVIILMRWADTKTTSATAALFIIANSASGLIGRALAGKLAFGNVQPFLFCAFLGAVAGSFWGAKLSSATKLRLALAIVLMVAAIKLFIPKG